MCNKGITKLNQPDNPSDLELKGHFLMDIPSLEPCPNPASGSNNEIPSVKLMCSFLGTIMPRPQDGKLRYVGGETRIVSVPRDITYAELMNRMTKLYEGASVLKYQQPDEDLDALVSVLNDDDLYNMLEDYDKLGSGDGFVKLRIFLFSHPYRDGSFPYGDGDDMGTEKRYVDALNNLNDACDYGMQQPESPVDDMHFPELYLNQMNLEGGFYNPGNSDLYMPPFGLHRLNIPHVGSGQHQVPVAPRYNVMEAPRSPAYHSPTHHGHSDSRQLAEFSSPPSAGHRVPFVEERVVDENAWQKLNHHPSFEHQTRFPGNLVPMPPGSMPDDFPGNILHGPSFEGISYSEHCWMASQKNQIHFEQNGNWLEQVPVSFSDFPQNRETIMSDADSQLHHDNHPQSSSREIHCHERGQVLQHDLNPLVGERSAHAPPVGRLNDHHISDPSGVNISCGQSNLVDGHHIYAKSIHSRGHKFVNEVFHDQVMAEAPYAHNPSNEEHFNQDGNRPYGYGIDNLYPVSYGHASGHPVWRYVQSPKHASPSYEASNSPCLVNGPVIPGFNKANPAGSPRLHTGLEVQNHWFDCSHRELGLNCPTSAECSHGLAPKVNPINVIDERQHESAPNHWPAGRLNSAPSRETVQQIDPIPTLAHDGIVSATADAIARNDTVVTISVKLDDIRMLNEENDARNAVKVDNSGESCLGQSSGIMVDDKCNMVSVKSIDPNCLKPAEGSGSTFQPDLKEPLEDTAISLNGLSLIPDLIATIKKAVLEETKEMKASVIENSDSSKNELVEKEVSATNSAEYPDLDSDNDSLKSSTIEPTKAEEEAIAQGLQTIKNEDLEDIREIGTGTYGAVYHGKWKGSDVAIKRIRADCFAGKPSERERLIADFWKEALTLSSLHHPNVVAFYGIVRDGPDGSLATITEFMVNGSLKQFLRKKDRTIDRRKRLIIAMDTSFGMEYLHGKNIVHFDLKCENLLVNMKDPQRPVCKIGDLGLSKVKQQTQVSGGVRGTLPWMAPELLSGKSNMVTDKIDVYSFGIVMWELLTGEEPYADMNGASIIGGIVNSTLRPQIPTWCDPEWKALMESCWESEPALRPSFSEISLKLRGMAAAMNVK